jgi:hypothetical protein
VPHGYAFGPTRVIPLAAGEVLNWRLPDQGGDAPAGVAPRLASGADHSGDSRA